jgi:uncharacterized membrane protein YphA (DoxX/SURF4 family)
MDVIVWILSFLLAVVFGGAGAMKALQPNEKFKVSGAQMGKWTQVYEAWWIKTIGTLEFLGGVGVILPVLTNILPWLTPLAALGLVFTMLGAAYTHFRHGENNKIIPNVVLGALALVVFVARLPLLTGA